MVGIQILDCTLRDGGYCNNWEFEQNNIKKVIDGLNNARVEIIECGYLNDNVKSNKDTSIYNSIPEAESYISKANGFTKYVCMINESDYFDIDSLPYCNGLIDGIRLAFHKKEIESALEHASLIKKKGYSVYFQPMVISDYTQIELSELVIKANGLSPYAFYIVDSFGSMKKNEFNNIFRLVNTLLNKEICIGFHSHNNMQLSFSNAQQLLENRGDRDVILDTSIFGMGRGAGNLNTELLQQFLNENYGKDYDIEAVLQVYDEVLSKFYNVHPWGYSLPNYLSAKYIAHPNYATFWMDKNTLTVTDLNRLFKQLALDKKNVFDRNYAEQLYIEYMNRNTYMEQVGIDFRNQINGTTVLIIASGKSALLQKDKIIEFIKQNDCVVISVNADYAYATVDYIFVSNLRRFNQIDKNLLSKMIITSNINCTGNYLSVDYSKYLNEYEEVEDNAGLMLVKLLVEEGARKICIAGMDGYSHDIESNYMDESMIIKTSNEVFDRRNEGINLFLNELSKKVDIQLITESKYISVQ